MNNIRLKKYIRRYTKLEYLSYMLDLERLILRSYNSWDDHNDKHFMQTYCSIKNLPNIYSLCATVAPEKHHHWKMFADGEDGVCIEFDRNKLESQLTQIPNLKFQEVEYIPVNDLENMGVSKFAEKLPFLKRVGFMDEAEYRIICSDPSAISDSLYLGINLSCIHRIILSPEADDYQFNETIDKINDIPNTSSIIIERSHLTNSKRWRSTTDRLI